MLDRKDATLNKYKDHYHVLMRELSKVGGSHTFENTFLKRSFMG